ncbi:cob(I)yrinic acid a,c-diamide adenosyltransferase [Candidatus Parcubacteria bacterium]|nr:cob(I)yrinic acid a,c-diamide adenosyltransferase [Candidatus Parcubacteria bacterium]
MLFTGKGDNGQMNTYGCDQKISKSSTIAEALGSMDEINSFLGFCKVRSQKAGFKVREEGPTFEHLIHNIQQSLFIIQAELAGFPMKIEEKKVKELEEIIRNIEKQLPPIKTFFISGGTELAATFDFARTMARRAERRVVAAHEEGKVQLGKDTLAYMNRLSSILYALARLTNHKSDIKEEPPSYK